MNHPPALPPPPQFQRLNPRPPRRAAKPLLAVAALVLLAGGATSIAQTAQPATWNGLPVGEVSVDGRTVLVVSATGSTPGYARSYDKLGSLGANEGLLHVFTGKGSDPRFGHCSNTIARLPKYADAIIDDDGTITYINDWSGNSEPARHCVRHESGRRLLMPYRWFAANGVQVGAVVTAFKPATEQRRTELAAQAPAAKKRMADLQEYEKQVAEIQRLSEKLLKHSDFLRQQAVRKKTDAALADLREVTTPAGSLLALIKDPTVCTNALISFCQRASQYDSDVHKTSGYDLKADGPYPLLPNEALLFMASDKVRHWGVSGIGQPISVAFLTEAGRIIEIQHGDDGSAQLAGIENYDQVKAKSAAHALVANAGWFDEHKLKAGDTIAFKRVTAPRRDELYAQGVQQAKTNLVSGVQADKHLLQQAALTAARYTGDMLDTLLQPGRAYNHRYLCEKEEAQGLLYVQSRDADGSVNAVYDLAVADIAQNTVADVRVQLKGSKAAAGVYDFTPVRTVKASNKYTVNSIRAYGKLDQLEVNLSGSACGTPGQLDFWTKVPDTFANIKMPVSVNLDGRALHRADFYYKAEREATRLAASADEKQEHLGIRLVAAGRAPLPGEPATTGQMFRIDAITNNKGSRNQEQSRKVAGEYALSQPCADTRSAYQCLHRNAVVHNDYIGGQRLQPKTGDWQNYTNKLRTDQISISYFRAATELELFNSMARAAKSEKVSWTPLDFAPQFEVASYQIQPGQPSASESQIDLRYRYARYVYLYSRVMMREQAEAFLQNYTLKVEGKQAKQRAMNADEARVFLLGESASRSMCSDRTFTVSITPKTAASRRNAAVDIDWTLLAERLEDGKPAIERRIHAAHYALNAKNGYSAKDTITFPCVTDALEQKGRAWIVSMDESIELKDVKFGADIVRVYE